MHRAYRLIGLLVAGLFCHASAAGAQDAGLHRLAGSMILTGFDGQSVEDPGFQRVEAQLTQGHIAGVIFFGDNITSPEAVLTLNSALRSATTPNGLLPLLAVDAEGGLVQRLKSPRTQRPLLLAQMPEAERNAVFAALAQSVAKAGFTLNLAPVVDLHDPNSPAIGRLGRSFSADPDTVTRVAASFIDAHRAQGLMTALKHFPGHGSARHDSHDGFVDITATWRPDELQPFFALIRSGKADTIMTAHVFHDDFDRSHPATLSKSVITDLLRGLLGFDGVVISDDLTMKAIDDSYSLEDAVLLAVDAGVDVLLTGNFEPDTLDQAQAIREILVEAVETGRLTRQRLQESHDRILALRQRLR